MVRSLAYDAGRVWDAAEDAPVETSRVADEKWLQGIKWVQGPIPIWKQEADAYTQHFSALLAEERQGEAAAVMKRVRRPKRDLQAEGYSAFGTLPPRSVFVIPGC